MDGEGTRRDYVSWYGPKDSFFFAAVADNDVSLLSIVGQVQRISGSLVAMAFCPSETQVRCVHSGQIVVDLIRNAK
jgi:hypothetical protein